MKILLTGGSGLLGTELTSLNEAIIAPKHNDLEVLDYFSCDRAIIKHKPDIVIHAAALTSPPRCEELPHSARSVNIIGTVNLVNICQDNNIRLVYISTDYVFAGDEGLYQEGDPINPINLYAKTKAAGELAVRTYDNSLVIRTSFCENEFPYEKAFVDQFTSRDYVDVIAPMILKQAESDLTGIVHVGTERKSVFELAVKRRPEVGELSIRDVSFDPPRDTSFYKE